MSAIVKLDTMLINNRMKWVPDESVREEPLKFLPNYAGFQPPCLVGPTNEMVVNKRYQIEVLGTVDPERYMVALTVNPMLYRYAQVSAPTLIAPAQGGPVRPMVTLTALRSFDLAELPWLVTLHLLD